MFPITYRKRFVYTIQGDTCWTADKLREYLAKRLARRGARHVTVNGKEIHFDGNAWITFTRRYFFDWVSKGKIIIDNRDDCLDVIYQIKFKAVYYFAIFLALIGLTILANFTFGRLPVSQGLGIFVMAFCWGGLICGSTIATSYYRFNRFIMNCVRDFFNSASNVDVQGKYIASH